MKLTRNDPEPVCQHSFHDPARAHYCDYIRVPGLLAAFYPEARTADELLLCSGLYAAALWWNLQESELRSLLDLVESGTPLTQSQCYAAIKQANRCVETDRILLQQAIILRSELLRRPVQLNFRFEGGDPGQLAVFERVSLLTRHLEQRLTALRTTPDHDQPAAGQLVSSLKDLILSHSDNFLSLQRDFGELIWAFHEQPAPRVVNFQTVVPEQTLLSFSRATLLKHHPQAGQNAHSHDELTFITAHQAFEVWFPAVITTIRTATGMLQSRPAQVWEAETLARRLAVIFELFGRMIHVPQTMSAADYIEFRDQLEAGSGVESFQFRAIEICAGLRDERYLANIEHMQLLTPDLRLLVDTPSLNDALMTLLADLGIIELSDPPAITARKLSRVLLPVGAVNPQVDIMALAEALVRFEQNVELWRTNHIAMVTRMIGRKTGTGAQTYGQLNQPQDEQRYDSLPYLYSTLKYRKIFPALWDARDYLQP